MVLVTLFMTGGHDVDMLDTGVELDCTCGCVDICAPDPIEPTEDVTPADDLSAEPMAEDGICGTDVPAPVGIACTTDADCGGEGGICVTSLGLCYKPTLTACTGDECGDLFDRGICLEAEGFCYIPLEDDAPDVDDPDTSEPPPDEV